MKQAYLIVGPESSGNRILAACLVRAGCHGAGSTQHEYQKTLPEDASPVALIRSLPHGGKWPNLLSIVADLHDCEYRVRALVVARHPVATAASQVARQAVASSQEAHKHIRHAYTTALVALAGVEWYLVPIESLRDPEALAALLLQLDLPPVVTGPLEWEGRPQDGGVVDMNQKHFTGDTHG